MQGSQAESSAVLPAGSGAVDRLTTIVFQKLWDRDKELTNYLLTHIPRRIEQEEMFRPKGPDCKYYKALCQTIAMDAVEGKPTPRILEILR